MTPLQIESKLAAIPGWAGELMLHVRARVKQEVPELTEIYKWNCIMWHKDGLLIVGAVPLKQAFKLCFFQLNEADSKLPEQRWSKTFVSQNRIYTSRETFDMAEVVQTLRKNVTHASSSASTAACAA